MEALMHYVWEHRLWGQLIPVGLLEGCDIEVLDVGLNNPHAGPDFLEAMIRIDDILWSGQVELHEQASAWLRHRHHLDPAYGGVILHVVERFDEDVLGYNGRPLPTLVMTIPERLRARASYLVRHSADLACAPWTERLSEGEILAPLEVLSRQRLRQKADSILQRARESDWHEALYTTVIRYFGFGINHDAMEALARQLPYRILGRYTDRPLAFDALLYGSAGLLDQLSCSPEQREALLEEYTFLANKYGLRPQPIPWKLGRTRPQNAPLRRLSQVAELLKKPGFTPSALLEARSLAELRAYFSPIAGASLEMLLINVACPYRFAARLEHDTEASPEEELKFLRELAPEHNRITRLFARAGLRPRDAADGQAVIQAYRSLCQQHRCIHCPWGKRLLKS